MVKKYFEHCEHSCQRDEAESLFVGVNDDLVFDVRILIFERSESNVNLYSTIDYLSI